MMNMSHSHRSLLACCVRPWAWCIVFGTLLVSCIQRDNPFDPVNYSPAVLSDSARTAARTTIDSLIDSAVVASRARVAGLSGIAAVLREDSASNAAVLDTNAALRQANARQRTANDSIAGANEAASAGDRLGPQSTLDSLPRLDPARDTTTAAETRDEVRVAQLWVRGLIDSVRLLYPDDTLYSSAERDSLDAIFDSLTAICFNLHGDALDITHTARDTNSLSIEPYNAWVAAYNDTVEHYNDSIAFVNAFASYPVLSDPDSIKTNVFQADAGDTVVLGAGAYRASIRFLNSGTPDSQIVVQGQPGATTILDSADVVCSNNGYIVFRNIVFRGGSGAGIRLTDGSGPVSFENCRFERNGANGLEIVDSDARLTNCEVLNNGGYGLRLSSSGSREETVSLENVLVAHNRAGGLEVVTVHLAMRRTTVSDNGGSGVRLRDPELSLTMDNCLVTFNTGYGTLVEAGTKSDEPFLVETSVFHGNTNGALQGGFPATPRHLSFEVAYVNREGDDYRIATGNRVYELQRQGIVLGYRP